MPTYLCHGFRWYRRNIRIFVILNNLDDCAPDWVVAPGTAATILSQLAETYDFVPRLENEDGTVTRPDSDTTPAQEKRRRVHDDDLVIPMPTSKVSASEDTVLMHEWSPVKLLEEYDVTETEYAARPYAYLADHVVRVDLGVDVVAEMAKYESTLKEKHMPWLDKLRAEVEPEEELRWYVVVCADEYRESPDEEGDGEGEENGDYSEDETLSRTISAQPTPDREVSMTDAPASATGDGWRNATGNRQGDTTATETAPQQRPKEQVTNKPAFLKQDPCKSESPPSSLRKKLSIRRLFSKKES